MNVKMNETKNNKTSYIVKAGKQGEIIIPKEVRKKLNIKPGDYARLNISCEKIEVIAINQPTN